MSDSVSFDRAASFYDSTRVTDAETLRVTVALLERDVASGEGPVLEIGVGTGALAVPLAARGVRVVGIDLSGEMMARLAGRRRRRLARRRGPAPVPRAFGAPMPGGYYT
jgi:cyclopropane fatty-acyl-phospholipid synthase-like methyltransferase